MAGNRPKHPKGKVLDDKELDRLLRASSRQAEPFSPYAWYNEDGDIIEVLWKGSLDHCAEWLNHQVTLIRDNATKEVVGVQVWGIDQDGKTTTISKAVRRKK